MQALLWDRRCVLALLDHLKVPTPRRLVVSRDGGPKVDPELARQVEASLGLVIQSPMPTPEVSMRADGDAIIVDGVEMEKPFVEKPASGEDHNVYIYFKGGGGRRLFRKVHLGTLIHINVLTSISPARLETNPVNRIPLSTTRALMGHIFTKSLLTSTTVGPLGSSVTLPALHIIQQRI